MGQSPQFCDRRCPEGGSAKFETEVGTVLIEAKRHLDAQTIEPKVLNVLRFSYTCHLSLRPGESHRDSRGCLYGMPLAKVKWGFLFDPAQFALGFLVEVQIAGVTESKERNTNTSQFLIGHANRPAVNALDQLQRIGLGHFQGLVQLKRLFEEAFGAFLARVIYRSAEAVDDPVTNSSRQSSQIHYAALLWLRI